MLSLHSGGRPNQERRTTTKGRTFLEALFRKQLIEEQTHYGEWLSLMSLLLLMMVNLERASWA